MHHLPWAAVAAIAWAAALLVAGFVAPVYESDGVDSAGRATHSADTLVEANGTGVAFVLAAPLVAALLAAVALRYGKRTAAWGIVAGLAAFCVVSLLSIGTFIAPVAILLALAARRA
jgi:hypothetical protein